MKERCFWAVDIILPQSHRLGPEEPKISKNKWSEQGGKTPLTFIIGKDHKDNGKIEK